MPDSLTIYIENEDYEFWGESQNDKIWIHPKAKDYKKIALHEFIHTIQLYNGMAHMESHGSSFFEIGKKIGVPKRVLKIDENGAY